MPEIDFETLRKAVEIIEDWEGHDGDEPEKDGAVYLAEALFELFSRSQPPNRG